MTQTDPTSPDRYRVVTFDVTETCRLRSVLVALSESPSASNEERALFRHVLAFVASGASECNISEAIGSLEASVQELQGHRRGLFETLHLLVGLMGRFAGEFWKSGLS